jgi:hypothetical protein
MREDLLENAVLRCLSSARLSEADVDWLVQRFREWRYIGNREAVIAALELDQIKLKEKQERLTDALIDRLIDQETYSQRAETLGMEQGILSERLSELKRFDLDEARIRKFLEPLKSLENAYQSADRSEKRSIVKLATSNRTLFGKKLGLEPSKLLQDVKLTASIRCGGPHRGADRTFEKILGLVSEDRMAGLAFPCKSH